MDAHSHPSFPAPRYGIYDLADQNGSYDGMEVVGRCDTRVSIVRAPGLLDIAHANQDKWMAGFDQYFRSAGGAHALGRRILVVVQTSDGSGLDDGNSQGTRGQRVQDGFARGKTQGLLEDYMILSLAAAEEKTMQAVQTVLAAAERGSLGRRDLMVAVGGRNVTDIVGFAAAIYRRSTRWISIPTDLIGIVLGCAAACHGSNELSLHHTTLSDRARVHRDAFTLSHPPIATLYDPASLLGPLPQGQARCFWAELVRIAVALGLDSDMFLHVETHMDSILAGLFQEQATPTTHLATAIDLAAAGLAKLEPPPLFGPLGGEAVRAVKLIRGSMAVCRADGADDADCLAMAVGLMASLSTLKGNLGHADLGRILHLLCRAGLRIYDGELEPGVLWEHMVLAASITRRPGGPGIGPEFLVPSASGNGAAVNISRADVGAALSTLCNQDGVERPATREQPPPYSEPTAVSSSAPDTTTAAAAAGESSDWAVHERTVSEDVRYRVVSVSQLLDKSNPTLIRDYCTTQEVTLYKKKILAVVDSYSDGIVPLVRGYLESHGSAIDGFHVLPMQVSSMHKDINTVLAVVDAAVAMGLSWRDLVVVVGGGTLMDIVGFASSMLRGGIPYVRIPTTLLGMIDAGVGVKVGVDWGGRKSTIGRYYAPVGCLNAPAQFLGTLPAREVACGLAEAIKMAVVKSPRILELIEQHYRRDSLERSVMNMDVTRELMRLSIRSMLEELQPNLYEQDLRRLVDFGHEFGHMIEAGAQYELPHGECVSIGMAISASLAHRKGILARPDLERILNVLLDVRLPIVATCHDCCNPAVLAAKVSTDVPRHKGGMLYLAVPQAIGKAVFLDHVADVDVGTMTETMLDLRRYADRHRASSTNLGSALAAVQQREEKEEEEEEEEGAEHGTQPRQPHVIVVDVGATYLRVGIMGPQGLLSHETTLHPSPSKQKHPGDCLSGLQRRLLEILVREIGTVMARRADLLLEEVGIALGAVVTREGVVQDASVLWGEPAQGYDLAQALLEPLAGVRLTILNDVSAAAWRYKDEGRFCLITVSSGLGNKVFNANLKALDRLELDTAGVGGEMGHVVVEPRAVDAVVQHATSRAIAHPDEFQASKVAAYACGEARGINARHLGMAAREGDDFALRVLEDADVPYCPCGNIADLCSYSSGRAALHRARRLAARQEHRHYGMAPDDVTDGWLQQAVAAGHPLALQVLQDATYYLALRILQLAADIGLDKFIIVGGFANVHGTYYLRALRHRLAHLCHASGFFRDWDQDRIHSLVRPGTGDDNDGLLGMGYFVQHVRSHYAAVEKPVREEALALATRRIPACGAREMLIQVVYAGICTTDLQILRHERGLEPVVLGHEGICRVVEVGREMRGEGWEAGEMVVLNPNNPLDDHDKLGHTREGLFQEYVKVDQGFLDRRQVLGLGRSAPSPTDTLIEPLSCVVAAQGRIRDRIPGANVLVVGAGVMGLLFVMMSSKMEARHVFLTNRSRERLDYAVSRRIVDPEKAFVGGGSASAMSSLVGGATKGEGVDLVIICVSLGQGVKAAQDAIAYVNPGGCVYLFAGFRPGDMLALEEGGGAGGGAKLDAWSVRAGWRTEKIHTTSGKCVHVSGHRGSRQQDLGTAADWIRRDSLHFGRVVSHIVSLDALPESMLTLARDGTIRGVPARRVIVDMEARCRVVEPAEMLPLRHLREAAAGRRRDAIGSGNLFREIGFDGATSLMGWVQPPAWSEIQASLEGVLGMRGGLGAKRHVIWVGTGGWVFLVDALRDLIGGGLAFHTCQSLDPQALRDLLLLIDDPSTAICLGVSQSGKTLETVALMNALREYFDHAGLDYRQHFLWLTDPGSQPLIRSGGNGRQPAIQSIRAAEHDWQHVGFVPLTVNNRSGINALFCAPHSMVMFLSLILLLQQDWQAMRQLYQQYLAGRGHVLSGSLLWDAYSVACSRRLQHIRFHLDEKVAQPVTSLVTQLVEQALGSKQAGFNPSVCVAHSSSKAAAAAVGVTDSEQAVVTLPMPADTSAAVKLMLTMDAMCVFVSCVAYHRRIEFVSHPQVDLYKRRAAELMMATDREAQHDKAPDLCPATRDDVVAHLKRNPQMRSVEILYYYGRRSTLTRHEVKARVMALFSPAIPGVSVEAYQGEEWNHSRYQAAIQREDTLHVILVLRDYLGEVEGISAETLSGHIRLLRAIARATYETLYPRAMFLQTREGFLGP